MAELHRCWLGYLFASGLTAKLQEAQNQIRRKAGSDTIRWFPPGEMALKLVTIGEVAVPSMLRLQGIIEQVAVRHGPIALSLEGAGGSPNLTMPKFAWIGVTGETDKLVALRKDLALCVQQFVTAIDEKAFEPLVEIGALRKFDDRARTEMGRSLKMTQLGKLADFTFDAVHVLESRATTAGPELYSVAQLPLVG